jgi:TetR/AcrR family transcriptional repressor of lmrAB and yxaGH operons
VCAVFDYFRAELRASDFRKACPIATVAQEVGGEHGALQTACSAIYAGWEELLTQALTLASGATASADGPAIAVLRQTSRLALGMIEGALLLAKTRRDVSYLDLAQQQLLALLPRPGC